MQEGNIAKYQRGKKTFKKRCALEAPLLHGQGFHSQLWYLQPHHGL